MAQACCQTNSIGGQNGTVLLLREPLVNFAIIRRTIRLEDVTVIEILADIRNLLQIAFPSIT